MTDNTAHIIDMHTAIEIPKHAKEWYAFWGNKCPQCGADAEVTNEA